MLRTECLDPNPDPSLVLLLLQFRIQICLFGLPMWIDLGFDACALANGTPFVLVQVMLGIFVSGSGLHRQIWKHAARTGLCEAMPCVSSSDAFQFVRFSLLALFAYVLSLALC